MKEIKDFNREKQFHYYNEKNNPFIFLTTKVDITNIYNKCKNKYGSIGYVIARAALNTDNFLYRYKNGKFYKCENIKTSYTEIDNNNNVGFFPFDYVEDYNEYINEFKKAQINFKESNIFMDENGDEEIWLSCTPWYKISSLITPFDKEIQIPQFFWDKFEFENEKVYINLTIHAHHGFVDGYHIAEFLQKLNDNIRNIDNYMKKFS